MNGLRPSSASNGRALHPAVAPVWRRVRSALALVQVRLRIPVVLVLAAVVVGRWDVIRNYWDRLSRPIASESISQRAVSADTEYFCPMDPGVISDWPGKCGACNMALVRRKRGEAFMLPDGVVARMQLSPYRVQLAGIQTAPAAFLPLMREVESSGRVARGQSSATVLVEIPARQAPWVSAGMVAHVACADLPGQEAFAGRVAAVTRETAGGWECLRTTVEIADPAPEIRPGMVAVVRIQTPMATLDPFRALSAEPPAHSHKPAGQVLAVPQSAVVDTGARKVVFVESMPGMFEGLEVVLGPLCGDFYPVVRGLEAGQKVAMAGAFLLDAETRLNPSLAAGYFGAGRGQRAISSEPRVTEPKPDPTAAARGDRSPDDHALGERNEFRSTVRTALRELSPDDRKLAERQKLCPVTNKPLGSMGTPARAVVDGRVVFLCCDGCEDALRREPAKHLAKLPGVASP
jgi:membrane fusion protein, copper/silver efflux system